MIKQLIQIISLLCLVLTPLVRAQADESTEKTSQEKTLDLNFEDASLAKVVAYLAKEKNIKIYIPNPALEAQKISLSTSKPMSLDDAWKTLLTLLEGCNFTMINVNGEYRIVPSPHAKQNPLPAYLNNNANDLPNSNEVVRFLYILKNIKLDAIRPFFDNMLSSGSVQYLQALNACLITEKSLYIKAVMKIIEELDRGGIRESIKILPLKYTNAPDVAKLFNEEVLGISKNPQQQIRIINPSNEGQVSYFSKESKIIPDPRTNNLILIGNEEGLNRLIQFIEKYIDKPLEAVESRLHVKELRYIDAEKAKPILDAIIKPPAGSKGPMVGDIKFFEDVVIAAESTTAPSTQDAASLGAGNRLIVACNKEDWARLEKFIDALDKPQAQVAMEVIIIDVKSDINKALGAQVRNKKSGSIGRTINAETQHLASISDYGTIGSIPSRSMIQSIGSTVAGSTTSNNVAIASFGKEGNIWGVVRSIVRTNSYNIISQPYLISRNQKSTTLNVTEQRVVNGDLKQSGVNTIRDKDTVNASLNLVITPRINTEGFIELTVAFVSAEFSSTTNTDGDRKNRTLTTRSTVGEGEVLILGGLTRKTAVEAINKTPILGDIPILKYLFRNKEKQVINEELFIFIRPTLIKPSFEGRPGEYTQLKLDYARAAITKENEFLVTSDPIDRWFFNMQTKKSTSSLLEGSIASREVQQLNSFVEAKHQPQAVVMNQEPYYMPEKAAARRKRIKAKKSPQS
jgi:general secretion pathway protein D